MSTHQPPGGSPPEPTPYAQPQDPWAHEPGVVAPPTDPIPQQQPYGQYVPGVAAPSVWSQETIAHGAPYGYAPAPASGRVARYVLISVAVAVLGGAGGFGAYYVVTHRNSGVTPQVSATTHPAANSSTSASTPSATPTLVPSAIKVGDCMVNIGTSVSPVMQLVPCSTPKSYKVLKIASGESIPEGPDGKFDGEHTAATVCAGTGYEAWYGWDSSDDKRDLFFCLSVGP